MARLFRLRAAAVLLILVALLLNGSPATAGLSRQPVASPVETLSTPALIEEALAHGEIDENTAQLYLAYAFGAYDQLPPRYHSTVPWNGTLPLLQLQETAATMQLNAATRTAIETLLNGTCGSSSGALPNTSNTTHFHVEYGTLGGGLSITDYTASLETTWATIIDDFGWAAPPVLAGSPPPGNRYHVRIDSLGGGLYGYVTNSGAHAGFVGDNPATTWNEGDAYASCMVLNADYSGFPGSSRQALDATTAHEFTHSVQFGYGAITGSNRPDQNFIEGSATWMEDEVFNAANDNYNYLWPIFNICMGEYDRFPYPYWITWRGMTERYGTGTAGGSEQVMQDFWEETSKSSSSNMLPALNTALVSKGTTLADAYHAYAVAIKFNKTCGSGYVYPYCFKEGASYVSAAGATAVHGAISTVGASHTGSVADNYALNWITLPTGSASYNVSLRNTSTGGQLRGSVVCDTGAALKVSPLPEVAGANQSSKLTNYDPTGCTSVVAVVTNQSQTSDNPSSCTARSYTLQTSTLAIAVTPAHFDDIGSVLTDMGYAWTQIADTALNSYGSISQYDVIFANCSIAGRSNGPNAANALRQFVQNGGSFYASDWAYTYINSAFPGYLSFHDPATIGDTGTVTAKVVDAGLAAYLNPTSPPSAISLNYDLSSWVPLSSVSANTTVHLEGSYATTAGQQTNKALVASFAPYADSAGRVIYTTFHNEPQLTDLQRKLIEYWVLIPTTSEMTTQAEETVKAQGVSVRQVNLNTINPGVASPKFSYDLGGRSKLVFVNNWPGSSLRLAVFRPDGALYQQVQSSSPPISITVADAQPGTWQFQVTGVDVPTANYPYVVAIGDTYSARSATYLPALLRNHASYVGFNSQFNGAASGWTPHSGAWTVDSTTYSTAGLAGTSASASYAATYANFDYQVRLRRSGSATNANRIIVRGTPTPLGGDNHWYSHYAFQYNADGKYSVYSIVAGGPAVALQDWTAATAINLGDTWNTLRVVANNSQLRFYINGSLVWSGTDTALTSGRVGLGMYRDTTSTGNRLWVDWATLIGASAASLEAPTGEISVEQQAWNEAARPQPGGDVNNAARQP